MAKWNRIGGGCSVTGDDAYPCSDSYENEKGERVMVRSTKEGHFKMPESTDDITALFYLTP